MEKSPDDTKKARPSEAGGEASERLESPRLKKGTGAKPGGRTNENDSSRTRKGDDGSGGSRGGGLGNE